MKDPNNVYVEGWGFAPVTKALNDAFLPDDPRKWTTIIDHEEFRAEGGTISSDVNQYTGIAYANIILVQGILLRLVRKR